MRSFGDVKPAVGRVLVASLVPGGSLLALAVFLAGRARRTRGRAPASSRDANP